MIGRTLRINQDREVSYKQDLQIGDSKAYYTKCKYLLAIKHFSFPLASILFQVKIRPVSDGRIYGTVCSHSVSVPSLTVYWVNMIFLFFFPSKPELVDLKQLFHNDNTVSCEMFNYSLNLR